MSRPASVRPSSSPFVRQKRKAGSKPIEIDYDRMDESYNHRLENDLNYNSLQHLRRELQATEDQLGASSSKAKKIRREINRQLEQGLFIQATWCQGCLRVLHLCRCPGLIRVTTSRSTEYRRKKRMQAAVSIVHRILQEATGKGPLTGKELRQLRRQEKEAKNNS